MSHFKRLLPSFGIAVMIVYFSYHALSGDRSVLRWMAYHEVESEARLVLANLETRRNALLLQNKMLRSDSLDLDYLDERVRIKLRFVHPSDRIVVLNAQQS